MPIVPRNVCLLFGGAGPQPSPRGPPRLLPLDDCMEALRSIALELLFNAAYWSNCLQFIVAYFVLKEMH